MTSDSQQLHAVDVLAEASAGDQATPLPAPAQTMIGEDEDAVRLVAQLSFGLVPNLKSISPTSHKLDLKFHVAVSFIAVTLDLLLVVYLLLILTRKIKPPVSAEAKGLMWAALAAKYAAFVVGIFIELLA